MKDSEIKKGEVFNGNTVADVRVFGDILVVWYTKELVEVYPFSKIERRQQKKYQIQGAEVVKAFIPPKKLDRLLSRTNQRAVLSKVSKRRMVWYRRISIMANRVFAR